jgi:hypothetical protein
VLFYHIDYSTRTKQLTHVITIPSIKTIPEEQIVAEERRAMQDEGICMPKKTLVQYLLGHSSLAT